MSHQHPLLATVQRDLTCYPPTSPEAVAARTVVSTLHWLAHDVDTGTDVPLDRARLASSLRRLAARVSDQGGIT